MIIDNLSRLFLSLLAIAIGVGSGAIVRAEPPEENAISQRRIRATFFEDERNSGFSNSFLGDALNGSADPLGSAGGTVGNITGTAGNIATSSDSLQTAENARNGGLSDRSADPSSISGSGEGGTSTGPATGIGIFRSLPPSRR